MLHPSQGAFLFLSFPRQSRGFCISRLVSHPRSREEGCSLSRRKKRRLSPAFIAVLELPNPFASHQTALFLSSSLPADAGIFGGVSVNPAFPCRPLLGTPVPRPSMQAAGCNSAFYAPNFGKNECFSRLPGANCSHEERNKKRPACAERLSGTWERTSPRQCSLQHLQKLDLLPAGAKHVEKAYSLFPKRQKTDRIVQ